MPRQVAAINAKVTMCKNNRYDGIVKRFRKSHPEARSLQAEGPYFNAPNEFELRISNELERHLTVYTNRHPATRTYVPNYLHISCNQVAAEREL